MRPFEYHSPHSLQEACTLLSSMGDDARILAGGTDVLVELRKSGARPCGAVVDITRIDTLRGVREAGDWLIVGPLTTHSEILHSNIIAEHAPLLSSAAAGIGSPQIRNRGTIGGNIMHAAACADTVPPLLALNAQVRLLSSRGERTVDLAEFFVKPYATIAHHQEILTEIRFPKLPRTARSSFVKLGRRKALSISRLSVAAVLVFASDGSIAEPRIVTGAAFPTWQRIPEAEAVLVGQKPSDELYYQSARKVSEALISITGRRWSTEYKEPVIAVLVRRALEACR